MLELRMMVYHGTYVRLQEEAQAATESLRPAHTWVPWVTVDGRPINAKQLGEAALIKRRVCDAIREPRCALLLGESCY